MPRRVSTGRVGRPILGDIFTQDNSIRSVETNANLVLQPDGTGVVESVSDIQTNAQAGVRFADSDSSNYVKLAGPATVASNFTLTLPSAGGSANQALITDGSGNLSFANNTLTVTNRTTADSGTYYIAMSDQTSGSETTLSVADGSRFNYVPNANTGTGRLTVGNASLTASTASSSTTSGALVVTGGVGISGTTNCTTLNCGALTATSITETSSIVLKENINPINNALDSILNLVGVTYDRKDGSAKNEAGLIAESVNEVLPNLVTKDDQGNPIGINYTKFSAYLIEAVKSLKLEIDELKKGSRNGNA